MPYEQTSDYLQWVRREEGDQQEREERTPKGRAMCSHETVLPSSGTRSCLATIFGLSREDMAGVTWLAKSRVDQIIRELTEADARRREMEALERLRRHVPRWLSPLSAEPEPTFAFIRELQITLRSL